MITPAFLVAATGCMRAAAETFAAPLSDAAARWKIDTRERIAAWIAQLAHESASFTRIEESLNYTTPARLIAVWPSRFRLPVTEREESVEIFHDGKRNPRRYVRAPEKLANFVYANRMGNHSEASGDGWDFRGRGLIQLTGRRNYGAYQLDSLRPVLAQPDILTSPEGAADSAGWFWSANDLNRYADAGDWLGLTRRINGGTHGLEARKRMTHQALASLQQERFA